MRISDGSSDVCSSDLLATNVNHGGEAEGDRLFGLETVIGSNYADSITGSDDVLAGDTLYGRGGDDLLVGGAGDDHLDGGSGNDLLRGGTGDAPSVVHQARAPVIEGASSEERRGGKEGVRTCGF